MFSGKVLRFLLAIYIEILISPSITEILLQPSQEFDSIVNDISTTSISNTINTSTTTTTTTTIINGIQTTPDIHLLDADSDDDATILRDSLYTNISTDSSSTLTTIILKSSESQISSRVSSKGAFFCRYHTVPYKTAKVRMYSNIVRVNENKQKLNYIVDGTESWEEGNFELEGENHDFTIPFRPVLVIYHQCGQLKRKNATYRRFIIKIPERFIDANESFYIGTINLELYFPAQKDGIKFIQFNKPLEISGELFCGERYNISTAIIRLFSTDKQEMDSFITEQQPNHDGYFRLYGARTMLQKPTLVISHQCGMTHNERQKDIYRQFIIYIPYFYYNSGRIGLKIFHIGRLGLDINYPNERNEPLTDITT
uniref:ZP domain-containing protein n=2 Tax=Onchocerca TaxID=6281 RepID=A0A8R1TKJ0_ONCVO